MKGRISSLNSIKIKNSEGIKTQLKPLCTIPLTTSPNIWIHVTFIALKPAAVTEEQRAAVSSIGERKMWLGGRGGLQKNITNSIDGSVI